MQKENSDNQVSYQTLQEEHSPNLSHHMKEVHIRIVVVRVGEINTIKEYFLAEVLLETKWKEERFNGRTSVNKCEIDWNEYWNPCIHFDSIIIVSKDRRSHDIMFNSGGEALFCERRFVMASFSQTMHLLHFPFDIQNLSIKVMSERSEGEFNFISSQPSSLSHDAFHTREWTPIQDIKVKTGKVRGCFEDLKPCVNFSFSIQRQHHFYLFNVLLVLFAINTLTFSTFWIGLHKTESRLQLTFLLLLSSITHRCNINNNLPKISYLTHLDKMILTSFGIQCCICVWHCIIASLYSSSLHSFSSQTNSILIPSFFPPSFYNLSTEATTTNPTIFQTSKIIETSKIMTKPSTLTTIALTTLTTITTRSFITRIEFSKPLPNKIKIIPISPTTPTTATTIKTPTTEITSTTASTSTSTATTPTVTATTPSATTPTVTTPTATATTPAATTPSATTPTVTTPTATTTTPTATTTTATTPTATTPTATTPTATTPTAITTTIDLEKVDKIVFILFFLFYFFVHMAFVVQVYKQKKLAGRPSSIKET